MVLAATNDRNSLHILVVEDEPILRDDIATYLRDCGCAIYEAATAEEAILMCSTVSLRLHVLFTDIYLNGAAVGLEVADVFRAARPAIGVLYTSGNPLNRTRCVLGSRFLPKPYNKGEVLKVCRDMHPGLHFKQEAACYRAPFLGTLGAHSGRQQK